MKRGFREYRAMNADIGQIDQKRLDLCKSASIRVENPVFFDRGEERLDADCADAEQRTPIKADRSETARSAQIRVDPRRKSLLSSAEAKSGWTRIARMQSEERG
jgi:hypothetical protein